VSQPNLANDAEQPVLEEEQSTLETQPQPVDVPTQKQKTDVYTVMLIIAFICIVTACILLYWELTLWGAYPWWNTSDGTPNVSQILSTASELLV
jgi:hypothetical protein